MAWGRRALKFTEDTIIFIYLFFFCVCEMRGAVVLGSRAHRSASVMPMREHARGPTRTAWDGGGHATRCAAKDLAVLTTTSAIHFLTWMFGLNESLQCDPGVRWPHPRSDARAAGISSLMSWRTWEPMAR